MSKKSKSKAKDKRKAEKRARKQAMKAKYQAFRDASKNTKSRRFLVSNKKGRSARIQDHPLGKCGNPGCIKCYGVSYRNFLVKGKPYRMPNWMYQRWKGSING